MTEFFYENGAHLFQAKESEENKNFVFSPYGSKVISTNVSATFDARHKRVRIRDSRFGVVNVQTFLYLCAKFHNFLPYSSMGCYRFPEWRKRRIQ